MTQPDISGILGRGRELLTSENLDDSRIDMAAQQSIARLSQGETEQQICALALLSGVKAESHGLAGIFGDDSTAAADIAAQLGTDASGLIPSQADVTLVTPPDSSIPTVVFRSEARDDTSRLDSAFTTLIGESGNMLSDRVDLSAAGDPATPWLCMWVCAMCALAIRAGNPGAPVCAACLTCVAGSS
ncbi:hypothetical protein [Phytohabitans houttuyneae]|uniref:Uncharacterized protein n=1 Tax=Phytohabitans houttuyneae TaxID=1076126 RepID=A0A6V8KMR7_9ACTN|nr:hypothetical protein [Phytohabitans houttuyneae]GFJ81935.1 hypothetical protein Phou_061150 [Phytohabitans houttuyneae]